MYFLDKNTTYIEDYSSNTDSPDKHEENIEKDNLNDSGNTSVGKDFGWRPSLVSGYETPGRKGLTTVSRGKSVHPSSS